MKKINVEPPPAEVELTITMSETEAFAEFLRDGPVWATSVGGRTAEAVYDALAEAGLAE